MKKKIVIGLSLLVMVAGIAFASVYKYHYRVFVHCSKCNASGEFEFDANNDTEARNKAKARLMHNTLSDGKSCNGKTYLGPSYSGDSTVKASITTKDEN